MVQKECIIYGSGEWGRQAYWEYAGSHEILFYVDKNAKRWGQCICGKEIRDTEELAEHREALVIIAIDNDAGIEEYVRSFGVEQVVHYRFDALTAKKPALIYGTGRESLEAARALGERWRLAGLIGESEEDSVEGIRVQKPEFLRDCPEAVLIIPEELAKEDNWARLRRFFQGDMLRYVPGEGLQTMLPPMVRRKPAIFMDVTISRKKKQGEGVARASTRLWQELKKLDSDLIPLRNLHGTAVTDFSFEGKNSEDYQVTFMPGDRLLLLDPSWPDYRDFASIIESAHKAGAKVYAMVYDLIPSYMPELFSDSIRRPFFYWHDLILQEADALLCISRYTAKKAAEYAKERNLTRENPPAIHVLHLGGDMQTEPEAEIRSELRDFLATRPVFLTVGTIEPRKGHLTIIKAFEILRKENKVRLLILGHDGWLNADIKKAIDDHKEQGILWLKDATDAELKYAYQNAAALISASKEEGFGLPLVEARNLGCPVICSDIEVFHEIMGAYADYFSVDDAEDLVKKMEMHYSNPKPSPMGKVAAARLTDEVVTGAYMRSWSQAATNLQEILTPIPKKLHFCWLSGEPYPPLVQQCLDSWQKFLPDYELKVWTKENSPLHDNAYIEEALSVGKYAFVSDYIRLYALYHEGGIYLDSDVEVLRDFAPLLSEPAFIGWERCGRVGPWLIASKPGNHVIKELLDEYEYKHFLTDGQMNLTVNTIPTTKLLIDKGLQPEDKIQRLEDFTVFPERYFCPKDPWTLEVEITEDTYAIHHFAGSWNHLADKDMPFIKAVPGYTRELVQRCRQEYTDRPIVIYGTGIVGWNIYKALKRIPEAPVITAFMVTRFDNAWRSIEGVPVVEICKAETWEKEPIVVMGTVDRYWESIEKSLREFGYHFVLPVTGVSRGGSED